MLAEKSVFRGVMARGVTVTPSWRKYTHNSIDIELYPVESMMVINNSWAAGLLSHPPGESYNQGSY